MIARFAVRLRRLRRWFTRSYWELRVIPLSKSEGTESSPGLIFVQIDGLSQKQMRKALGRGHLPFLKRLLEKEKYSEYSLYSGVPSATPAVQGELFYGVKGCVPAFNFRDHQSGETFTMYEPKAASEIEKRLAQENKGLLEGGSSYSNIFSGGAAESHFCAATLGWQGFFKALNPLRWTVLFIFHFDILIRSLFLLVLEFVLAFYDCVRGVLKGQYLFMELQFILTRVFICVLLRELIALGAKIDIARGLPVIHVNFFGYDEQAHRRGPSSSFAHWGLQGIDSAIAELWRAARLTERRDYDLWLYSDHGQEDTLPYPVEHGKKIESVIGEVFGEAADSFGRSGCCGGRYSHSRFTSKMVPPGHPPGKSETKTPQVSVLGMGPLCHIYPAIPLDENEKDKVAKIILEKAKVPLVLIPEKGSGARAVTASGNFKLPDDAASILGHDHPFLEEVTEDLLQLCHHPNTGEMIVSGWLNGQKPRTFPVENGSHAGFGPEETRAFAILPQDAPLPSRLHEYLRPLDLREAALRLLGRGEAEVTYESQKNEVARKWVRIACYNVHGCLGMDGRRSPERIARVIARHDPDAIALQELDAHCERSGSIHQAETIANKLKMSFHFHPSYCLNGHFGNGILSRYPMRLVKVGPLPQMAQRKVFEPRGALWVELDLQGMKVQLITTHLSLWPQERLLQLESLLGREWLGHPDCKNPVVLAGDFNSGPSSRVYKRITSKLHDAQLLLQFHRPHGTWLHGAGSPPFTRIDHVFVSPDIKVNRILVPQTELDRAASDHFPLFIDLEILGTISAGPADGMPLSLEHFNLGGKHENSV